MWGAFFYSNILGAFIPRVVELIGEVLLQLVVTFGTVNHQFQFPPGGIIPGVRITVTSAQRVFWGEGGGGYMHKRVFAADTIKGYLPVNSFTRSIKREW